MNVSDSFPSFLYTLENTVVQTDPMNGLKRFTFCNLIFRHCDDKVIGKHCDDLSRGRIHRFLVFVKVYLENFFFAGLSWCEKNT